MNLWKKTTDSLMKNFSSAAFISYMPWSKNLAIHGLFQGLTVPTRKHKLSQISQYKIFNLNSWSFVIMFIADHQDVKISFPFGGALDLLRGLVLPPRPIARVPSRRAPNTTRSRSGRKSILPTGSLISAVNKTIFAATRARFDLPEADQGWPHVLLRRQDV